MIPLRNTPSKVPAPPIDTTPGPSSRSRGEVHQIGADKRAERAGDVRDRGRSGT